MWESCIMVLALIRCERSLPLRGHWLMLWWCRCLGGFPSSAWEFWTKKGLVTGGLYGSKVGKCKVKQSDAAVKVKSELDLSLTGCQPYSIPPCEHHVNGTLSPCNSTQETPKCKKKCINGYPKSYLEDKHFGTCVQPDFICCFSPCFCCWCYFSPWFHLLQVNAHTASPPSRNRSWRSCTRTVLWRQPSLYMQIFCTTRQVRMLKRLFT